MRSFIQKMFHLSQRNTQFRTGATEAQMTTHTKTESRDQKLESIEMSLSQATHQYSGSYVICRLRLNFSFQYHPSSFKHRLEASVDF